MLDLFLVQIGNTDQNYANNKIFLYQEQRYSSEFISSPYPHTHQIQSANSLGLQTLFRYKGNLLDFSIYSIPKCYLFLQAHFDYKFTNLLILLFYQSISWSSSEKYIEFVLQILMTEGIIVTEKCSYSSMLKRKNTGL